MKPNKLGGQTLEGAEIYAAIEILAAGGFTDEVDRLGAHIKSVDEQRAEYFDSELYDSRRSSGFISLSEREYLKGLQENLELNATDTKLVIDSLRKASNRKSAVSISSRKAAKLMLGQYDGPSTLEKILQRIDRALGI